MENPIIVPFDLKWISLDVITNYLPDIKQNHL